MFMLHHHPDNIMLNIIVSQLYTIMNHNTFLTTPQLNITTQVPESNMESQESPMVKQMSLSTKEAHNTLTLKEDMSKPDNWAPIEQETLFYTMIK